MIFSMKTDVNTLTISTTCKLLNFSDQSMLLRQILIFFMYQIYGIPTLFVCTEVKMGR